MCVTCDIPCYIRKRFYDVCVLYVRCVRYNVLTPPSLSLHAQVPNTLDVLSEEDFMMTQPRLVHLNGTLTVL